MTHLADRRLVEFAEAVETRVDPVTTGEARGRGLPVGLAGKLPRPRRRVVMGLATTLALAVLILVAFARSGERVERVRTGSPQGDSASRSTTPGSAPSATSRTTDPTTPTRSGTDLELIAPVLPETGFAVVDGDTLLLIASSGEVLARGSAPQTSAGRGQRAETTVAGGVVTLTLPDVPTQRRPADPRFSADCLAPAPASVEVVVVARCGDPVTPPRLDVWRKGSVRTLSGPPPSKTAQPSVGHWVSAEPSPNGDWVLALWSGECEVPTTFLLPMGAGTPRTVTGEALADWATGPESSAAGWTTDGKAVFAAPAGACGTGVSKPGVYTTTPGGHAALLYATATDHPSAFAWLRSRYEPMTRTEPAPDGSVDTTAFNAQIESVRPSWAVDPTQAALAFVGPADNWKRDTGSAALERDQWRVTITDSRLPDDSVNGRRYILVFRTTPSTRLELISASVAWRCQPGRGHQDFAPDPCT